MINETINQAINQIKSARNILIISGSGTNIDSVAAGLALKNFLTTLDKQSKVIVIGEVSDKLKFLPESTDLNAAEQLHRNAVVEVNLGKTELAELTYQKLPEVLKIFLTPKAGGEFQEQDFTIKGAVYPYDLVITLGVSSLEELGNFYATHAQLFFDTPTINIDFKPSNDNFAPVNLVNLVASSTTEIVFDLLETFDLNLIDDKIATLLLTGLIFATNSFQSQKTSPQVFQKASRLVVLGGRQQEIISNLYRSKSLGLLHLWGRVLARLKQEDDAGIVYSSVASTDIERSEATISDQNEIIPEMTQQLAFAKHFVFMVEQGQVTAVFVCLGAPLNAAILFTQYNPQIINQQTTKFIVSKPLADTEAEVIPALKAELAKQTR